MSQFVSSGVGGKFFLSTFLYEEFGNRRRAFSNWESSRGQCLLLKWSKYFSSFPLPFLNFCLLHPFLYHVSPTGLLFCFLWHLACAFPVTSVPILLPFLSAIALTPRLPGDRLLHPWWFEFPFRLRSGSLASRPATAPSRARHSFTVVAADF